MAKTSTLCNFTIEHYQDCITTARDNGYKIGKVCDYEKLGDKYILLRHDVDFCLEQAYDMAMVDFDLDVSSTFYILLQSTTYNVLSPNNQEIIRIIDAHDHEIAWQVDTRNPIAIEYTILESIIRDKIKSFAQHYSTLTPKPNNPLLIDAMDWKRLNVKYLSESGRNWREGCMCDHINEERHERMEILTHPIWWVRNAKSRFEAIDKLYDDLVFDCKYMVDEFRDIVTEYISTLKTEKPIIH